MDKLNAMAAFTKVVALGSYAEAGRQLGLTRSAVSKGVIELEQILGARLLDRTTRKVSVTEAGMAYYERCLAILADIEETAARGGLLSMEIEFSLRCNYRCPYCYVPRSPDVSQELTRREIKDVLAYLKVLANPADGRYLELNLAPNGAWWSGTSSRASAQPPNAASAPPTAAHSNPGSIPCGRAWIAAATKSPAGSRRRTCSAPTMAKTNDFGFRLIVEKYTSPPGFTSDRQERITS